MIVRREGRREVVPSKGTIHLRKGDRIVLWTSGGGYGDPLRRPPEQVCADLRNRKISEEAARTLYGVVIADGELSGPATQELRARLAEDRPARSDEQSPTDAATGSATP